VAKKSKIKKAPVRSRRMGKMRVRSILYKHYKARYPNWASTKQDAEAVIQDFKAKGYKRPTKKSVLETVKLKRLQEIQRKKEITKPKEPVEHFFKYAEHLLQPIPFYEIQQFCYEWHLLSKRVMVVSKYIWTTGIGYHGGTMIPYEETFQNYCNQLEKLQATPRRAGESYETDWYFRLLINNAVWSEEHQAYIVVMITCDAEGQRTYYFNEQIEKEEKLPPVIEKPPEAKPPIEKPPEEKPPEAKPVPPEITSEQRMELEKEKIKIEAQERAKADVKIKMIESAERMLEKGTITFDQYMKIIEKLY
jgi:hypothetical protein